jgi:hypothetical protein
MVFLTNFPAKLSSSCDHGLPRGSSPSVWKQLFYLPADIRKIIWELVFDDSRIMKIGQRTDACPASMLSKLGKTMERYQLGQPCRLAYRDCFEILWPSTKIRYIDCVPPASTKGRKNESQAALPCKARMVHVQVSFSYHSSRTGTWEDCDDSLTSEHSCSESLRYII